MWLNIKWDTGQMRIEYESFFPATQNNLNVLMKTIELDWEHKEDILKQMLQFLKDLEKDAEDRKQEIKKNFGTQFQKMKDMERMVQTCKHPNGVPITKIEMRQLEADLKRQKVKVHNLERDFKRYSKTAQKAKVNRDIIIKKGGVKC